MGVSTTARKPDESRIFGQQFENRNRERRGLAGTRLRAGEQVAAL